MTEENIKLKKEHLKEKYKNKKDLPKSIRLEACTLCQLKCPACYMRQDPQGVEKGCGKGILSFENFKKLVDENPYLENIELSNSGEIFLNPQLIKIMEYAYEKGINLTADNGVNLNYLSDEQAEALVKYQFKSIVISIDGASQETYEIYRVGGNYNKVLENIKKIKKIKKKYKSERPNLIWKFIVFGHNEHEIKKVKKEAKKIGIDDLVFDMNYEKEYSPIMNPDFVRKETGIDYLDRNTEPALKLKEFLDGKSDWYFCKDLWEPQINWDGQVLGCCAIYSRNFGGNVFKEGLLEALNNPKMIYAKNMVINNAEPIKGVPCTDCWCYRDMKEKNIWLKSLKNN